MDNTYNISKKEYFRLMVESERLNRLEIGGVDNWEFYGDSLNPDGEESMEEFEDALKIKLFGE